MSSRIPPSQRDRSNLAAALRQTDRQVRSLSGPGYFGGRLGIPQPIPGSTHLDALLDDDDGDGTEEDVDIPVWEDRDRYVLTTGDVARGHFRHQLLYSEIVGDHEFTAFLNGVALDPSRYLLDPVNGVVVVTLSGWERAGYHYRFMYAYTGTDVSGVEDLPIAPTGVGGWRYLQIAMADAVDRSAVGYTDGSWSVGSTPFGSSEGQPDGTNHVPGWTYWNDQTGLWVRRIVHTAPGEAVTVSGKIDNIIDVYWNGVLVLHADHSGSTMQPYSVVIPAASVLSSNTLAIRAQDDVVDFGAAEGCYVEIGVTK